MTATVRGFRPAAASRVLEHHLLVYRRAWRGSVFSTFLSPVLFLAAIGIGLGTLVDDGAAGGVEGVPYLVFLAPGLLAAQAMQTGTSESTYPVMAGLVWLRSYVAMVSTPIKPFDVVIGNLLFVTFRLILAGGVFVLVSIVFGAVDPLRGVAMLPAAVLTGLAFAAPVQAFAASQKNDRGFAALNRFLITPLFLFSGTFFPISQLPPLLQPIAYLTPLWHGVTLTRGIALGTLDPLVATANVVVLLGFVAVGVVLASRAFGRRLIQ